MIQNVLLHFKRLLYVVKSVVLSLFRGVPKNIYQNLLIAGPRFL